MGGRDTEGVAAGTEAGRWAAYAEGSERDRRGYALPPPYRAPGGPSLRPPGNPERDWDPAAGHWPLDIPEGGAPTLGPGRWGSDPGMYREAGRGAGFGGGTAERSPSPQPQGMGRGPPQQEPGEEQQSGPERAAAAVVAKGLTRRSGVKVETLAPFVAGAVAAFKEEMHGPNTEVDTRPRWQEALDAIKEGAETVYRQELARVVSQFQSCLRIVGMGATGVGERVQQLGQSLRKAAEDLWDDKWKEAVKAAFADGLQPGRRYSCSYLMAGFLSGVDCAQWVEEQIVQARFQDDTLDSRLEQFRSVLTVRREDEDYQPAPASWSPEMVKVTPWPQGTAMRRLADAMAATQKNLGKKILKAEQKTEGGGSGRRHAGLAGGGGGVTGGAATTPMGAQSWEGAGPGRSAPPSGPWRASGGPQGGENWFGSGAGAGLRATAPGGVWGPAAGGWQGQTGGGGAGWLGGAQPRAPPPSFGGGGARGDGGYGAPDWEGEGRVRGPGSGGGRPPRHPGAAGGGGSRAAAGGAGAPRMGMGAQPGGWQAGHGGAAGPGAGSPAEGNEQVRLQEVNAWRAQRGFTLLASQEVWDDLRAAGACLDNWRGTCRRGGSCKHVHVGGPGDLAALAREKELSRWQPKN